MPALHAAERRDVPGLEEQLGGTRVLAQPQQRNVHDANVTASGGLQGNVPARAALTTRLAPERHEGLPLSIGGDQEAIGAGEPSTGLPDEGIDAGRGDQQPVIGAEEGLHVHGMRGGPFEPVIELAVQVAAHRPAPGRRRGR